ncbi:conjugal transfer protein TraD, partial [Klebsiella pneumoniae]
AVSHRRGETTKRAFRKSKISEKDTPSAATVVVLCRHETNSGGKMHENEWLEKRLAYIRGLNAPNEQQRLLLMLAQLSQPTPNDRRKLGVLIRAEKAAERALKARADAAKVLNAERRAVRKARDHELYKAAGLMGVAGVVDRETGRLNVDAGLLVGLLMELAAGTLPENLHQEALKSRGDAAIAAREKKNKTNQAG